MSCLFSKNLDTIFEDPKRVIVETNLAFLQNTYYVKIKLITYLFMRYLSNMQVAWPHRSTSHVLQKHVFEQFLIR
jgi:hypothetical protein